MASMRLKRGTLYNGQRFFDFVGFVGIVRVVRVVSVRPCCRHWQWRRAEGQDKRDAEMEHYVIGDYVGTA